MKYSHLAISTDHLFKMTVKQRDTYVRKLRAMTMAEVMQGRGALSLSSPLLDPCLLPGKFCKALLMMSF